MPGRYGVVATPGADRIARGEEWLQTNTLDGQKAHDSFLRVGEPSFSRSSGRPATTWRSALPIRRLSTVALRPYARQRSDRHRHRLHQYGDGPGHDGAESRTPDERLYSSGTSDSSPSRSAM